MSSMNELELRRLNQLSRSIPQGPMIPAEIEAPEGETVRLSHLHMDDWIPLSGGDSLSDLNNLSVKDRIAKGDTREAYDYISPHIITVSLKDEPDGREYIASGHQEVALWLTRIAKRSKIFVKSYFSDTTPFDERLPSFLMRFKESNMDPEIPRTLLRADPDELWMLRLADRDLAPNERMRRLNVLQATTWPKTTLGKQGIPLIDAMEGSTDLLATQTRRILEQQWGLDKEKARYYLELGSMLDPTLVREIEMRDGDELEHMNYLRLIGTRFSGAKYKKLLLPFYRMGLIGFPEADSFSNDVIEWKSVTNDSKFFGECVETVLNYTDRITREYPDIPKNRLKTIALNSLRKAAQFQMNDTSSRALIGMLFTALLGGARIEDVEQELERVTGDKWNRYLDNLSKSTLEDEGLIFESRSTHQKAYS